jgi:hypothetical protein
MTDTITIPADSARAIAELAVALKCDELAHARARDELNAAEDVCQHTLASDRASYIASQRAEDAARKVAARFAQIARFQDRMLSGNEAIAANAHDLSECWNDLADRYQRRADSYSAQIAKARAA